MSGRMGELKSNSGEELKLLAGRVTRTLDMDSSPVVCTILDQLRERLLRGNPESAICASDNHLPEASRIDSTVPKALIMKTGRSSSRTYHLRTSALLLTGM